MIKFAQQHYKRELWGAWLQASARLHRILRVPAGPFSGCRSESGRLDDHVLGIDADVRESASRVPSTSAECLLNPQYAGNKYQTRLRVTTLLLYRDRSSSILSSLASLPQFPDAPETVWITGAVSRGMFRDRLFRVPPEHFRLPELECPINWRRPANLVAGSGHCADSAEQSTIQNQLADCNRWFDPVTGHHHQGHLRDPPRNPQPKLNRSSRIPPVSFMMRSASPGIGTMDKR